MSAPGPKSAPPQETSPELCDRRRAVNTERDVPLVMEGPCHDHVHLSTAFPPAK